MTLLAIEGVSKRYGRAVALEDVALAIPEGGRTAIVGPSGSGKSTLLRLLVGFEAPDRGRILLGRDCLADGPASRPAHARAIGIVAQDGALFPHLSVAQNIAFGLDREARRASGAVRDLMRVVELDEALHDRHPHEVSGGQQQRVALARALARKPRLMLLDEPFSALDTGLRDATRRAVARVLAQAGITCILVTHDQAEALSFADRVAVLRDGRVAQFGTPRELYLRPRDRAVAAFLGDAIVLPAEIRGGSALCRLGEVAVDPGTPGGPAEIMLRPEQVRLDPVAPGSAGETGPGCVGRVTDITFGGALSGITVELVDRDGAPDTAASRLDLKGFGLDLPRVGDRVRITVTDRAHVFGREAPSAASKADFTKTNAHG